MKNYVEPIVNLLYLSNEDVLTVSDPIGDDIFDGAEKETEAAGEE